jgi:hypothetical protein
MLMPFVSQTPVIQFVKPKRTTQGKVRLSMLTEIATLPVKVGAATKSRVRATPSPIRGEDLKAEPGTANDPVSDISVAGDVHKPTEPLTVTFGSPLGDHVSIEPSPTCGTGSSAMWK